MKFEDLPKNIRLTGDRVLIKDEKPEEKRGSLYLPQGAKVPAPESVKAEVLAVGPGKMRDDGSRDPMPLKRGYIVFVTQYAGTELYTLENELYRIVKLEDIEAILTEE